MRLLSLICGVAIGLASASSPAATFVIINMDDPGIGLDDLSIPPAAAGCEADETLVARRLRAINFAAAKWGAVLASGVPIEVEVGMSSLSMACRTHSRPRPSCAIRTSSGSVQRPTSDRSSCSRVPQRSS